MIAGCFAIDDSAMPSFAIAGKPVLFCRGQFDTVIPAGKFEQAERYLKGRSGALTAFIEYEGGHELPLPIKSSIRTWLIECEGGARSSGGAWWGPASKFGSASGGEQGWQYV